MNKIFVNARFLTQKVTGVQRFAEEISLELSKIRDDLVFVSPRGILRDDVAQKLNVRVVGSSSGQLWEQTGLPFFLTLRGQPLLVNLTSTAPILYRNNIVTHHDITYARYPESFSVNFRRWYGFCVPKILGSSRALITVSEFSKSELIDYYGYPGEKCYVVSNAVSASFIEQHLQRAPVEKPYFLAVSSPNLHKNFHGLLRAYAQFEFRDKVDLKIIGQQSSAFSSQLYKSGSTAEVGVKFLGRVSDAELSRLYSGALAFVFPSFYEGFGIPPLEAQACGCPVLSSSAASLPEVLSDSALFFEPANDAELCMAMRRIFVDKGLKDELVRKGYANVARYSWRKSAQIVSDLIDRVVGGRDV